MPTREELLGAAQRQLNLDATSSMAQIASAAGVGRATLHRHFDNREALLTEIGERSLDRWQQRLDDVDVERVAASGDADLVLETIGTLLRGYVADSDDFGFALTDAVVTSLSELVARSQVLFEREVALYEAGRALGVLRLDASPRWLSHATYGLLVAARDALRSGDVAHHGLGDLVVSTFLQGGQGR